MCFLDNTGEALTGLLREGRAGSSTTADHISVLDQALTQIPDAVRHGTPILLRSDSAGSSHGFLAHIQALREQHLDIRFSVGAAITEPVRAAIRAATGWVPAVDTDGDLREHAEVCEITGLFHAAGWPEGPRFLVRRERPHPDHPHCPPDPGRYRRQLALGRCAHQRIHQAHRTTPARRLTQRVSSRPAARRGTRPRAGPSPCQQNTYHHTNRINRSAPIRSPLK